MPNLLCLKSITVNANVWFILKRDSHTLANIQCSLTGMWQSCRSEPTKNLKYYMTTRMHVGAKDKYLLLSFYSVKRIADRVGFQFQVNAYSKSALKSGESHKSFQIICGLPRTGRVFLIYRIHVRRTAIIVIVFRIEPVNP